MASKTHNNMNYYFAHFCHEENKWILNNQRFLLTVSPGNILLGQYITSNWFNCPMHQEKNMKFVVIGVDKKEKRHGIIDTLNLNINPFAIGHGTKKIFIEMFEYSRSETEKLVEEKADKNIVLFGNKNTKNQLIVRMIYHDKLLLATLPQFELETGISIF